MRLSLTLSLVLATGVLLRAEAPPLQGTLPEDYLPALKPLLLTAVERSPTTIASSLNLAQAEAAKYLNAQSLWPSVTANANIEKSKEALTNGTPNTSNALLYGASLYQPLFQWGAYKNQAQIGNLAYKIAERQFADAYRTLATSIREQYMGLIEKRVILRNARFQQHLAEKALATQKARFEAGSVSEAEVQGFNMNVDDTTLAADRAEEDYRYSKRVFTRLVGIDDLSDDLIPLEIPHPEYSASLADAVLSGFVGQGIETTFQSQVYKMNLEQADKNISIAKVRLLPKFAGTASYNQTNNTSISGTSINQDKIQQETFSLQANWTIFDGFATRGTRLSALASKRQTELSEKNYVDSTLDSISYLRHQLGFAQRAMALTEVHDALYASQLKRFREDKDLGYASEATIDVGTLNVNAADLNMELARVTYLSNWTDFISLAGIDPAIDNVPSRYVR